jgi:hypothetical protein
MSGCLCECLSTAWMRLLETTRAMQAPKLSLNAVLDSLTTRQLEIELQERRCVSEAKRHHACGSKALFRAKMLERRRLQAQLLQLQRYRENVHAQLDALSHHEINQTFMRAMACNKPLLSREEAETTLEDIQESVNGARELTELLGQPLDVGLDVTDDDLELEFMESVVTEAPRLPDAIIAPVRQPEPVVAQPPMQLVLPAALSI